MGIYALQLGVNLVWTPLFFARRNPSAALLNLGVLVGMVAGMTWLFWGVDEAAGWLSLPYLFWIVFASYLNYGIVKLNPGDGVDSKK